MSMSKAETPSAYNIQPGFATTWLVAMYLEAARSSHMNPKVATYVILHVLDIPCVGLAKVHFVFLHTMALIVISRL